MTKKVEPWNDSWSMSESYAHFNKDDNEFGWWVDGLIATKYGFVGAYSQSDHTSLRFIWDGRMYVRNWESEYSQQFIVTLSKRFVRDITGHEKVG